MRVVQLLGPADARFTDLVRLTSVAVASQAGLAVDSCDELRLAVDEACLGMLSTDAHEIHATFVEDDVALTISICGDVPVDVELDAQASLTLTMMTDHFSVGTDGELLLRKRLR
jgi:hypothetical protein